MKRIIHILFCSLPIFAFGQATSFKATADTNQILLGEEVAIIYELTYPGSIDPQTVQFPDLSDSLSIKWIQFGSALSSFLNLGWFPKRTNKHTAQTGAIVDFFEKNNNIDSVTHDIVCLAGKIISRGKTPLIDF